MILRLFGKGFKIIEMFKEEDISLDVLKYARKGVYNESVKR